MRKPVTLIVLDGFGERQEFEGNAVQQAKLKNLSALRTKYPLCFLQASGMSVGLPWGEPGNSEVGHLCLGGGRIIYQNLPRITISIQDGSFFSNPAFTKCIQHAKTNNSTLHIMGLVSSGSVHSNFEHLEALIDLAKNQSIQKLFIHVFTDGRDAGTNEGIKILETLELFLQEKAIGKIATLMGRFFAMDRNNNWDRIEQAYKCMFSGEGKTAPSYKEALQEQYAQNISDEYVPPYVIDPEGTIKENDAMIFFNFREDRAKQLTKALALPSFSKFERGALPANTILATMVEYEKDLPVEIAFPPVKVSNTLSETLSKNQVKQIHIAETEKYAHVTYFFNGGIEQAWENEEWKLIPSSGTQNFSDEPEMRASEIKDEVVKSIRSMQYQFILANFANPDMVGHTGNLEATIRSLEFLDKQIQEIVEAVLDADGILLITSDHGNCEHMIDRATGEKLTQHTDNPVPCFFISNQWEIKNAGQYRSYQIDKRPKGILADLAPTVLDILNIDQPEEMTGYSLLKSLNLSKS
jgi:2,3-bisphosphoglycerate-independent phosphoglycerate mutase